MAINFAKGTELGLRLKLRGIEEEYIREAFRQIQDYINQQDILRGVWRKQEFKFDKAGTFKLRHCMPFVPCDFLFTGFFGGITATVNSDTVTRDEFEITVSGPGKVRMLIGNITNFDTR